MTVDDLIAVLGTLLGALIGGGLAYYSQRNATRDTVAAEREARLWQARSVLYAEILAYIGHRGFTRVQVTRTVRFTDEDEQLLTNLAKTFNPPSWFEFNGRVRALASEPVYEAFGEAHDADSDVSRQFIRAQQSRGSEGVDAWAELDRLVTVAAAADTALMQVVRGELNR